MTARHTCLRNSKSLFESFHFLRRLELAFRPKDSFHSPNANPLASQTFGKPKRKIPRRHDMPDTVPFEKFADHLRERGFLLLSALKFLFQLRVTGDLVDSGLTAAAIELKIAQQQGSSSSELEKDKSIGCSESCDIQHVRRGLAGSDDKSCWSHSDQVLRKPGLPVSHFLGLRVRFSQTFRKAMDASRRQWHE
jgi:hypothetical protein